MKEKYMLLALKEAKKAFNKGEIPVGAIIVKDGVVISRAHNEKEKYNMATKHAEIIAIEKASKKLNSWRLDGCVMYVTLEPCMMCAGALVQSRIKKVIYSINNEKFGGGERISQLLLNKNNNHIVEIESGIGFMESKMLLQEFFQNLRNKL
jgi:tRNA(adenine34) deaminase